MKTVRWYLLLGSQLLIILGFWFWNHWKHPLGNLFTGEPAGQLLAYGRLAGLLAAFGVLLQLVLVYGNRNREGVVFRKELDDPPPAGDSASPMC